MSHTPRTSRLRTLLLAAVGAVVVACADGNPVSSDALASLRAGGNGGDLAIAGYVLQYSGSGGDSIPNDTLGALEPVVGALVRAIRLGDLPPDTSDSTGGGDTTGTGGGDTTGTGGGDSTGTDSSRTDSSAFRGSFARFASSTRDSGNVGGPLIPAQPDAEDRTARDGAFRLDGLVAGIYRVEVQRPQEQRVFAWTIVSLRDSTASVTFRLPPRR